MLCERCGGGVGASGAGVVGASGGGAALGLGERGELTGEATGGRGQEDKAGGEFCASWAGGVLGPTCRWQSLRGRAGSVCANFGLPRWVRCVGGRSQRWASMVLARWAPNVSDTNSNIANSNTFLG